MSTVQKLSQFSHRIFNTSVTEKTVARNSNPFAASNFQKNILTEDVFESSASKSKLNLNDKITAGSKRIYSTFVGSISDFGNKFYEGIQSLMEFGSKVKNNIVNTWNKLNEIGNTEIRLDGAKDVLSRDITSFFGANHTREIHKMSKMDPHTQLKPMLQEALSALDADMVTAA